MSTYITETEYRWYVGFSLILAMGVIVFPFLAFYYFPGNVCENKPFEGGYIKVCHTEPSPHDKRKQ